MVDDIEASTTKIRFIRGDIMRNSKKEKHPSILETVHETAKGLYDANIIDTVTMREFDELCLPKVKELSSRH